MAFDGLMTAALVKELSDTLTGGRIIKIAQPEKDELQLQIKNYDTYKLLISADASLPLLYLTDESKQSPYSLSDTAGTGTHCRFHGGAFE